ncbi:hypothetical protein VN12_23460 [Pirellula sp. SH-Sr6A]|uniref:hypothetical protein n=1 Tax=Pirellula sp. SH-Sr6A TaxID=1632865 RepID=UPI00078B35C8|nr:hypothetical protein [Pirellula sp. SH-Sr6A]AMV35104.1 hypothetical protein VN12_23460 [Pirellula sp. SH-Sr6A]
MTTEPESEISSDAGTEISDGLRDRLLFRCKRIELELPDYGTIEIFPYISSGAMSAAATSIEEETNILRSVLEASVNKDKVSSDQLSDNDWVVIAKHFLKTLDTEAEFESQLEKGANCSEAFAKCFVGSSIWKETEESFEEFRKSMELQASPFIEAAQSLQKSFELMNPANSIGLSLINMIGSRNPIWDITQSISERSTIRLPSFDLLHPEMDFLRSFEKQAEEIRRIQDAHISTMLNIERLTTIPFFENYKGFESLTALNSVIADAVKHTEDSNAYFSSQDYLSPFQVRRILRSNSLDEGWVEEVEQIETAIVIEALLKQSVVDDVVRPRLKQLKKAKRLNEFSDLERRVRALEIEKEEDFHNLLTRFATRVARYDHRVFWLEYGSKFIPRPEAIGRSLLGNFLDGNARGRAFVGQEVAAGEGFIDVHSFANGKHFIVELKVVGCGWGIGKSDLGLHQLDYYDARFENAELFLIVFDGRKSDKGRQLEDEYEIANGKIVKVITIPIYSVAPTSAM